MGDGLADNRPEGEANGREWRTTPLWGLGRVSQLNNRASLLHDGRARTVEEAILWHGGEAEASKQAYMKLNEQQRLKLLEFLKTL